MCSFRLVFGMYVMFCFSFWSEYQFHTNLHIPVLLSAAFIVRQFTGNTFTRMRALETWHCAAEPTVQVCSSAGGYFQPDAGTPFCSPSPPSTSTLHLPGVFVAVRTDCSASRTTSFSCPPRFSKSEMMYSGMLNFHQPVAVVTPRAC